MATVYALCGGDILKVDAILLTPYQDIFLKLWHDKEVFEYQERLRKIISLKK